MLDRTQAPATYPFGKISLPNIDIKTINGHEIHILNLGNQPVIKAEIYFNAGSKYDSIFGQSYITSKMILEGTNKFTSNEIAQYYAQIGFFVEVAQGTERLSISLNGLSKHFEKALEMVLHVLKDCTFPQNELDHIKKTTEQNIQLNQEKTNVLASQLYKETVFGPNNYLGHNLNINDLNQINKSHIEEFYRKNIQNCGFTLLVSGQISKEIESAILLHIQSITIETNTATPQPLIIEASQNREIYFKKPGAMQTSIRLGNTSINRNHQDYTSLFVANIALGGYFGSRLMKNIREDKGYTYGIGSSLIPLKKDGYWMISSDITKQNTYQAVNEVYNEIEKIQNIEMDEQELSTVQNFIIGDYSSSFNTAFDIMEKHKMMVFESLDESYFSNYIEKVRAVTGADIKKIAQKYWAKDQIYQIIVGDID